MFGVTGEMTFEFNDDGHFYYVIFSYDYPNSIHWVPEYEDDFYCPSRDELKEAQEIVDVAIKLFTEKYGPYTYYEDESYIWDLSNDFFERCLWIETQKFGESAVVIGYEID